ARDYAASPGSGIDVALLHHLRVNAGDKIGDILDLRVRALFALDLHHLLDSGVDEDALGIAQGPQDEAGVEFARLDDRLLHILMDRRFLGDHEAGAQLVCRLVPAKKEQLPPEQWATRMDRS